MNLETSVAGLRLEHPLMNAAGTCKTLEDVEKLCSSATSAIMVGSITMESRPGNDGSVYWVEPMFSLNSLGLPNRGAVYYRKFLPEIATMALRAEKPLFVSVAGFSPDEYVHLAELAFDGGADLVELNLGCPNVWQGQKQKRIACFDPKLVEAVLFSVEEKVGIRARVAVKISPFSDPIALYQLAQVLRSSSMVKAVTTVNTFPNAFSYNGERSAITSGNGLAGLSGPAMRPIGLGQVCQLRELLPNEIQIIGVGGIGSGEHVRQYHSSGADVVQVATAYLERGEKVFSEILDELLTHE